MSKKKVTAPLTYDPGKGRPKEHLAYLNWQEMQALKRLNGNNQERGPMGLPSFPPGGTTGKSSSKSTGGKTTGKSTTKSSGPGGGMMGGSGSGGPSRTAPSKASSPSNNSGAGRQGGGGGSRSVGGGSATRGAGPRSGVSGSRSPTSGSKKDSGKGPSMSKSPTRGLGETKLPSGGRTGFAGAGKNALSPKGGIGDLGGPKKDGQAARIKGAIESVKNAVAMDPSIPGRLARANENYKTVTAPGGMVTRVYSDPDIKKSTLGQTVSDAWKSTTDAISGWFNGPNLGNTPQEKAVAGFLKEAGMFPGPTTKKPIQDRIAPTPPSQRLYDPKYGPQLPTKAFYDRVAPTKPPTMPRQYAEKIYSPALSRTRVYDQPDLKTEIMRGTAEVNRIAKEVEAILNDRYDGTYGPQLPSGGVSLGKPRGLDGSVFKQGPVSPDPRASAEQTLRAYEAQKRLANPPVQKYQDRVPQTFPTSGVLNSEYSVPRMGFQEDKPTYSYDDSYMPPRPAASAPVIGNPFKGFGGAAYRDQIDKIAGAMPQGAGPKFKTVDKPVEINISGGPAPRPSLGYGFDPNSEVQRAAIDRGLTESVVNGYVNALDPKTASPSLPKKVGKYDVYNAADYNNSLAIQVPSPAQSLPKGYFGKVKTEETPSPTSVDEKILGVENVPERPQGPINVSQEAQDVMTEQEKKNKYALRGMRMLGPPGRALGAVDTLLGLFTGRGISERTADLKRAYMQADPATRAQMEAKYPNLTKFANDAGVGAQLSIDNYKSWQERSGLAGQGSREGGRDSGFGIAALVSPSGTTTPAPTESTTGTKPKGPRPPVYYQWDLGVNIPSPSDPNYTQYQTYLAERAAAQAAMYG